MTDLEGFREQQVTTPSDSAMTAETKEVLGWIAERKFYPSGRIERIGCLIERLTTLIARVEGERDAGAENLHYANGVVDLAIQHRDAAEAEVAALKHDIERHYNMTCEQANEIVSLRDALEKAATAAETVTHAPNYDPPMPPNEQFSLGFDMGRHAAAEAVRALAVKP